MEDEFLEIKMPEGMAKEAEATGKEEKTSRLRQLWEAQKKASKKAGKYLKKGAVKTGEYIAEGFEYLEKEKLKELEDIEKTRPLTDYEKKKKERLKRKIEKFERLAMKQKEKYEKLKEVV